MTIGSASNEAQQMASDGKDRHFLQLHDGDHELVPEIGRVLCIALDQGFGAVSVARPGTGAAITQNLRDRGIDVAAAQKDNRYVVLDAATVLARITRRGSPDEELFNTVIGEIVDPMCAAFQRLSVFGEMVGLLWDSGKREEALRLETLWNQFMQTRPVLLYCAYPRQAATDPVHADAFRDICAAHCRLLHAGGPLA